MKEQDEKYFAKVDKNLDDKYPHERASRLKALNMRAKKLLFDLFVFRGMDTARTLHRREDFR
jgi:hypothetical protein